MVRNRWRWAYAGSTCLLMAVVGCDCEDASTGLLDPAGFAVEALGGTSCGGEAVTLDARAVGGREPYSYAWSPTVGLSDPTSAQPRAQPGMADAYTVSVTDAEGRVASRQVSVLAGTAPVVRLAFGAGAAPTCEGESVQLDASGSTDRLGRPLAFSWHGVEASEATGVARPVSAVPGLIVGVTVVDPDGCATTVEQSLQVSRLPDVAVTFAQGAAESCEGSIVEIEATSTDPALTYAWDLDGDANTIESSAARPPPFVANGSMIARLRATNTAGCAVEVEHPVIARALPQAILDVAQVGQLCSGDAVSFSAALSTAADGSPISAFAWDFDGDGVVDSQDETPAPVPLASSSMARLTVTDDAGCIATAERALDVRARPLAVMALGGGRPFICDGDETSLDGTQSRDAFGAAVTSYAWSYEASGAAATSTDAVTSEFLPTGPAALQVRDAAGCSSQTMQTIATGGARSVFSVNEASEQGEPERALDVVFVVDNSLSMRDEIAAVERSINSDFAGIIGESGVDYRIIMLSRHGSSAVSQSICVRAPLGGTNCSPIPSRPVNGERFFHYDVEVGSHDALSLVLDTYRRADRNNFAPQGWSAWLRPGALKAFVVMTDDESTLAADTFETRLFALDPEQFGSPEARNHIWYSITGGAGTTTPLAADAPLVTTMCGRGMVEAAGLEYQKLSMRTGGLRFPICEFASFSTVFRGLARGVVSEVRVSCDLPLPEGPHPSSVRFDYAAGDGRRIELRPVANLEACVADAFYVDGTHVRLCPETCTVVHADARASLALTGCAAP